MGIGVRVGSGTGVSVAVRVGASVEVGSGVATEVAGSPSQAKRSPAETTHNAKSDPNRNLLIKNPISARLNNRPAVSPSPSLLDVSRLAG